MSCKRCFAIFLFSVFCSVSQASGVDSCLEAADPVARLAAFVVELVQEKIVEFQSLDTFIQADPDSKIGLEELRATIAPTSFHLQHFDIEYTRFGEAQRKSFREALVRYLSASENQEQERSDVEHDTEIFIDFARVQSGTVKIPSAREDDETKFRVFSMEKDLEVMTTHVTLEMFREVVGIDLIGYRDPDFPVYESSIWMAMLFANRLSEEKGYEPVYALPELDWDSESDLEVLVSQDLATLEGVIREFPEGMSKPIGYRLPTVQELEFIVGSIEQNLAVYGTGMELEDTPDNMKYYWCFENAKDNLRVVGSKLPFTVQNQELYDLYGLVKTWMHPTDPPLDYEQPPYFSLGTYLSLTTNHFTVGANRMYDGVNAAEENIGFRLVREVSR